MRTSIFLVVILTVFGLSIAHADMKAIKAYKELNPGNKVSCNICHVADKPTKELHELNKEGELWKKH